jgi:hypothetical protein
VTIFALHYNKDEFMANKTPLRLDNNVRGVRRGHAQAKIDDRQGETDQAVFYEHPQGVVSGERRVQQVTIDI